MASLGRKRELIYFAHETCGTTDLHNIFLLHIKTAKNIIGSNSVEKQNNYPH